MPNGSDATGLEDNSTPTVIRFYCFRLQPLNYYENAGYSEEALNEIADYRALTGGTYGDWIDAGRGIGYEITGHTGKRYDLFEGKKVFVRIWEGKNGPCLNTVRHWCCV